MMHTADSLSELGLSSLLRYQVECLSFSLRLFMVLFVLYGFFSFVCACVFVFMCVCIRECKFQVSVKQLWKVVLVVLHELKPEASNEKTKPVSGGLGV